ncbi:uncharacterized protein [Diabrotica undecimpunctata]|uniref:uncharacterized protein isoform X2 n=1 Tax=Diabrotica undecimpunctata TaxID=50387 RepID=UPI003B63D279
MKYLVSYLLMGLMFCVSSNKSQLPYPPGINAIIYYETGCPYDKSFIEQQFNPIIEGNLSKFVNLQLLSFDAKPIKYPSFVTMSCYDDSRGTCIDDLDIIKKNAKSIRCLKDMICYLRKIKKHFELEPIDTVDKFCSTAKLRSYDFRHQHCSDEELKLHFQKPINIENGTLDEIDLKSNLKPVEKNVAITTIKWEAKSVCMDRIKKAKEFERDQLKAEKLKVDDSSAGTHTVININTLLLGFFVYLNIQFYYRKVE